MCQNGGPEVSPPQGLKQRLLLVTSNEKAPLKERGRSVAIFWVR